MNLFPNIPVSESIRFTADDGKVYLLQSVPAKASQFQVFNVIGPVPMLCYKDGDHMGMSSLPDDVRWKLLVHEPTLVQLWIDATFTDGVVPARERRWVVLQPAV